MKKAAALFGIIMALVVSGVIYPATMEVVEVDEQCDVVTFETSQGDLFQITGVGDWEVGDFASLIMYNNDTPTIVDDVILVAQYSGFHAYG